VRPGLQALVLHADHDKHVLLSNQCFRTDEQSERAQNSMTLGCLGSCDVVKQRQLEPQSYEARALQHHAASEHQTCHIDWTAPNASRACVVCVEVHVLEQHC
jgi:hypothetical protein